MSAIRERDAERSREAILDAAERLFADRGVAGTSLADIGAAARLSRGTPGYFFGSKDALHRAVLERCAARARAAVRSGLERSRASGRGPDAILAGAVADYFDFLTSNEHFVRLIEWEALDGAAALQAHPPHADALREALAAISAELEFDPSQEREAAHLLLSIIALCWFPVVHARTLLPSLGLDPSSPAFREERRRHVIALVMQGMSAINRPAAAGRSMS